MEWSNIGKLCSGLLTPKNVWPHMFPETGYGMDASATGEGPSLGGTHDNWQGDVTLGSTVV